MAILGTVVSINGAADAVGKVIVISDGGAKRILQLNDGVKTGDTIITPEGVIVELELANGKPLAIFAGQTVKLTDELADVVPASSGDSAIDQATIQAVITAINEGRDISDVLEETAAGLDGGAVTAYGFGFEILPRIIEGLNPLAFDFAANRTGEIEIQPLFSEENDFLAAINADTTSTGGGTSVPPGAPTVTIPDTNGVAAGDMTVAETAGATAGSFTITAPAGVQSISVGGTSVTEAQLTNLGTTPVSINTGEGTLILTGYNAGTGVVSYTYDPDVQSNNGDVTDVIPVVVTDDLGATSTDNIDIVITDTAPVAVDDANSVTEDTSLTASGNVTGNDTASADVNATPITAATPTLTYGSLVLNSDGSYTYTLDNSNPAVNALNAGETLTDTYTYTYTDGDGTTATADLVITINGNNDAPIAVTDTYTMAEDGTPITLNPLTGDSDPDGTTPTIESINGVALTGGAQSISVTNGTVNISSGGAITFTPDPDFNGTITFPYVITDGLLTATADQEITVTAENDAPVAVDDSITVAEDTPFNSVVDLDANDTDIDGDSLTVVPGTFATAQGGSITIAADGSYTYTPPANYNGPDSVDYTVTDGSLTDIGTLNITVNPVNDAPVAVDDSITVTEDTPFNSVVDLDANDTDIDGDSLTVVPGTFATAQGGSITIAADGSYTYTPPANYNGPDSVDYTVTDGSLTDVGTLSITVTPVNDAPVISAAGQSTGTEDTPLILTWSSFGTITDVDNVASDLSIQINSLPADGVLTLGGVAVTAGQVITKASIDAGDLVFTPETNESGIDAYAAAGVGNLNQTYATFDYQVTDGSLTSGTATYQVDINPVADAPNLSLEHAAGIGATSHTPPASTGLSVNQYTNTPLIDQTVAADVANFEAAIEAETPTSTSIYTNAEVLAADAVADTAVRMTGFIYMEAGSTYDFSGYRDDTFILKVGGNTLQADGFNTWGNFNATSFTPTTSGYYSIEIDYYNGDGAGAMDINLSVDGGPAQDFNTTNFNIYSSAADFSTGAGVGEEVVINDGGYYPTQIATNSSFALGDITATLVDADGSETLTLAISTLPVGTTITDGTNTFTATAGNTSVDITSWSVNNITLTPPTDFTGTFDVTVTATSTETSGGSASTVATIPVVTNSAPTTVADTATNVEGTTTLNATVLANDSDVDGNSLSVARVATNTSGLNAQAVNGSNTVTTALGGTVVMNADGTYTYTAPVRDHSDGIADTDSFAYIANDGSANSVWTTVTINIQDTVPVANDDIDSVGLGGSVTGNVVTGAGGNVADTLNADVPTSNQWVTNVTLTQGTLISNNTSGGVTTIVTTNGQLVIQQDGSYTYTQTPPSDITVSNPTSVSSFTNAGFNVYGFENAQAYNSSNNPNSGLNLSSLNASSASLVSYDSGGIGPDQDTTPSSNQSRLEQDEELVIQMAGLTKSATVSVSDLGSGEYAEWFAYDASGNVVGTGTLSGGGTQSFEVTSGTAFEYILIRGGFSDEFRISGIRISPEVTASPDQFTYTITDSDGDSDTATLTMNYDSNVTANADTVSVSEAGINGSSTQSPGTLANSDAETAMGNLLANDTGITANTQIVNVNGVTPVGGVITITNAAATVQIYTQDGSGHVKGDYVVTLTGNTQEGVDDVISLTYNLQNSITGETDSASLTINVIDDAPLTQDSIVQVTQNEIADTNLVFVIDVSGSMAGEVKNIDANGNVTIMNRLDATKLAVEAVINEYFSQGGNVAVKLVAFESTATLLNGGTAYTDAASAIAALNTLSASGGTNYEAGLQQAMNAFTMDGAVDTTENNTIYFISDGVPTQGDTTDPAANGYRTFTSTNQIDSYAIGIGTGIADTTELDNIHNVDSDDSGTKDKAIIVANVAQLDEVLLASVPTSYSGSITGNTVSSSLNFGADGGYVSNLVMVLDTDADNIPDTDVTFVYDPSTDQITVIGGFPASGFPQSGSLLTLDASVGFTTGELIFDFSTGEYTYQTAGIANEGDQFDLNYVAVDGDGDMASGKQTIQIVDAKPVANNDIDTLTDNATFFEGNVITAIGTDGGDNVQLTSFSTGRSGEDNPGDGATVTSIEFNGATFDLTTPATGSLAGGSYVVSSVNGVNTLVWTASSGGASLTFNAEGYYKYTPPTAELSTNVAGPSVNYLLTSAGGISNAAAAGMTLTGVARTSSVEGSATVNTSGSGAGVAGNDGTRVDRLESLVITFNTATHPHGVQDVIIDLNNANSNLGGSLALSYTIYDIHGNLLGQFSSNSEAPINMGYAGIGKIVIESGGFSDPYGTIEDISFSTILDTPGTLAPAPEVISYTISDVDGDTSTATLTLNNIIDNIAGTSANNTINGTGHNESISGFGGADIINAGAGFDIVRGGTGNDTIDGGADDDQLYGEDGDDVISGGTGSDLIYGDAGNDTLSGNAGADTLYGGAGNDIVNGGDGDDLIVGGAGNDTLTGGAGVDVFKWTLNDQGTAGSPAKDVITDFNPASVGGDVLDLKDLLVGEQHVSGVGNLESYLHFEQVGSDTVVHISHNGGFSEGYSPTVESQTITLANVDLVTSLGSDQAIIDNLLANNKLVVD